MATNSGSAVPAEGPRASETEASPTPAKILLAPDQAPRKARRRGAERATQILQIAERMFCDRGYSATSMDDIAEAVGILKGSLYYYVNSKEDLLFRIVEGVHTSVTEIFEAAAAREDLTALERVVLYVRTQLLHNAAHVTELTVYHRDWLRLDGDRLEEIKKRRRAHEARLRALLEEARTAGEIPGSTDLRLAMRHTFAVTIWPYTWYHPSESITPADLADSAAAYVRAGLSSAT